MTQSKKALDRRTRNLIVMILAPLMAICISFLCWLANLYSTGIFVLSAFVLVLFIATPLLYIVPLYLKQPSKAFSARTYKSSFVFEIVAGKIVYRGWDFVSNHLYRKIPMGLVFGKSGVALLLLCGKPMFYVPNGQNAELVLSDHVFDDKDVRVDGQFVEVRIY